MIISISVYIELAAWKLLGKLCKFEPENLPIINRKKKIMEMWEKFWSQKREKPENGGKIIRKQTKKVEEIGVKFSYWMEN